MKITSGWSTQEDSRRAAKEAYSRMQGERGSHPQLLFVHSSCRYDNAAVLGCLGGLAPGVPVHGGTSCLGVMTQAGFHTRDGCGIGLLGIWDPGGCYGVGMADYGRDPAEAATSALVEAMEAADRPGELPGAIVMACCPGFEETSIRAIEGHLGPHVPILGGTTADNDMSGQWQQFANGRVVTEGIAIAVLFPTGSVAYCFHSGYEPTEHKGRATRTEGRVLYEIDGRPAAVVYNEWTKGLISDILPDGGSLVPTASYTPLGTPVGHIEGIPYFRLSYPVEALSNGALMLFTEAPRADDVVLMHGTPESLATRAGRVASAAVKTADFEAQEIEGALVLFCTGCMLAVQDRMAQALAGLQSALHGAPLLCSFTLGEQGCFIGGENRHGNLMIAVLLFGPAKMGCPMGDFEELREALLNLEESRKKEAMQRQMAESLLAGLRAMIMTDDSHELFGGLFEITRNALAFKAAFVLLENPSGTLVPLACSDALFADTVWRPGDMLARVLDGRTICLFDTHQVPEWNAQPLQVREAVRSALLFPIHTVKRKAVFVCTHAGRSHFNREHVQYAQRFSVLASQALQKLEFEERLADLEKRLAAEARLAEMHRKLAESEKKLARSQKMEAIGTLAGGIAHEFNNILGILLGNIELALMDIPDEHPSRRHLLEVRKASDRAKTVVHQILSFSRHSDPEFKPVHVSAIIEESISFLRSSLPSSIDIRLSIHTPEDTVLGDSTQIYQVLVNLCANATHAMRENGGTLDIRLDRLRIDAAGEAGYPALRPGEYVAMQVADTGRGIARDILERIFDPFFTTKGVGEGSGMGLAVVQGIIMNHGGAIRVSSEPGQGTVFTVVLPLFRGTPVSGEAPPGDLPSGHERILVVDDEAAIAQVMQLMLERFGYRVDTRTSSPEALALFEKDPHRFDLVITDMTMPDLTGDKLAAAVLRTRPDMPIILCTGYSERVFDQRAKEMGIRAFVTKPLNMQQTAQTVRRVLDEVMSSVSGSRP